MDVSQTGDESIQQSVESKCQGYRYMGKQPELNMFENVDKTYGQEDDVENVGHYETGSTDETSSADESGNGSIESYVTGESSLRSESEVTGLSMLCTRTRCCIVLLLLYASVVAVVVGILFAIILLKIFALDSALKFTAKANNETKEERENNYNSFNLKMSTFAKSVRGLEDKVDDLITKTNFLQILIQNYGVRIQRLQGINSLPPGYAELSSSCSDILRTDPEVKSGYKFLKSTSYQLRNVYCHMNGCGSAPGAWMRVAKVDVDDCPFGLKSVKVYGPKLCITTVEPGCVAVRYPVFGFKYRKVCGRIRGYKLGTPDGFLGRRGNRLTDNYVDGISVVTTNMMHIWTFVAGGECTCKDSTPAFISDDWTCDTTPNCRVGQLCQSLLWSSQQCGTNVEWFNKVMDHKTADDILVRVCRNQLHGDENLGISILELYIQ